jgi:6,7-dimethyl-8-ribityllumazine synthase
MAHKPELISLPLWFPDAQATAKKTEEKMKRIGVVDTTFARVAMGGVVVETLVGLDDYGTRFEVIRRTVPGFKDLPVEAKILFEHEHVDAAVCCGWVGGVDIDTQCARSLTRPHDGAADDQPAHP